MKKEGGNVRYTNVKKQDTLEKLALNKISPKILMNFLVYEIPLHKIPLTPFVTKCLKNSSFVINCFFTDF